MHLFQTITIVILIEIFIARIVFAHQDPPPKQTSGYYLYHRPLADETHFQYLQNLVGSQQTLTKVRPLKFYILQHPKQVKTSLIILLLLSGDIAKNPGPRAPKFPCGMCKKAVKNNCPAIQCDNCNIWIHNKCSGITENEYQNFLQRSNLTFICPHCNLPTFLKNCSYPIELSDNQYEPLLDNTPGLSDTDSNSSLPSISTPSDFKPAPNATSSPSKNYRTSKAILENFRVVSINCNSVQSIGKRAELQAMIHHQYFGKIEKLEEVVYLC